MTAIVLQRLNEPDARRGAILDGFPRTVDQARKLNEILGRMGRRVDAVIYLRVPVEVVLERVAERYSCPNCGATYNVRSSPTRVPGTCDNCNGKLAQRYDDQPDVARRRLEVYEEQTAPLIDFYRDQNVLIEVDGAQSIDRVLESEIAGLKHLAQSQTNHSKEPKKLG
jgi:adenylate kinase